MSVATSAIRSTQLNPPSSATQIKQSASQNNLDYSLIKKIKKEDNDVPVIKSVNAENNQSPHNNNQTTKSDSNNYKTTGGNCTSGITSTQSYSEAIYHGSVIHGQANSCTTTATTTSLGGSHTYSNGIYNSSANNHSVNGIPNGIPPQYSCSTNNINGMSSNSIDPAAPLQNDIFELLNEFWRPNELVSPDTHIMNGKFARRSPDGSIDETAEEEKGKKLAWYSRTLPPQEGDDETASIAEHDVNSDRNTQKRRYSRLSDGYERLKSVLPSVKDKRRVSKARILDEAINYIQRLESITNVLKREHEKRLSMLNGSNGFFPDYSVQPYMRSLFQNKGYPPGMSAAKMGQYAKMSNAATSSLSKSPRMKQYGQQYTSQSGMAANMATDYNYNNISNYSSTAGASIYQSSADQSQLMSGEASPITNSSPYSACSLSPGSTPTTYQSGSAVNNSWPYQGGAMTGYSDSSSSQYSGYSQSRQGSAGYASSSGAGAYTSLNGGGGNMWGSMGMTEGTSQVVPHADHPMKVG